MSKYVVVTFADQTKADEGAAAFEALHMDGTISTYGMMVVKREADGTITTTKRAAIGDGIDALSEALVGALAQPASGRYIHGDVSDELLEDIARELRPGTYAVISEVAESSTAPLDTRMTALGGKVLREDRAPLVDEILQRRVEQRRARLAAWKAKHAGERAEETETKLELEAMDLRDKLLRTAEKAQNRIDDAKHELDEKLKRLADQATKATPDVRQHIEDRIAELRDDFAERERRLDQAIDVARDALAL